MVAEPELTILALLAHVLSLTPAARAGIATTAGHFLSSFATTMKIIRPLFLCYWELLFVCFLWISCPIVQAQDTCVAENGSSCQETEENPSLTIWHERREAVDDDYGVAQQRPPHDDDNEAFQETFQKMKDYMNNVVANDPNLSILDCKNKHANCVEWASTGECQANPPYMLKSCAPACNSCDKLTFEGRCGEMMESTRDIKGVWHESGSVTRFFERLLVDAAEFEPVVHSRPNAAQNIPPNNSDVVPIEGPWVVTMSNVLSEEECNTLIQLGQDRGYKRSTGLGAKLEDGTYSNDETEIRTSSNTWCLEDCYEDPITKRVLERLYNITMLPEENSEYLQLLNYQESQFYQTHHDYLPHHVDRPMGVRIMTLFLYLNTVPEGGGTEFPELGIVVQAKRGTALLWTNVLDEDPYGKDARTEHQALPVIRGEKYGANAWYHQGDFKSAFKKGCSD